MDRSIKLQILKSCTGCGRCVSACPERALSLEAEHADGFGEKKAVVDGLLCSSCGECVPICPYDALQLNA